MVPDAASLLSFKSGEPVLSQDGLAMIRHIARPTQVVVFAGDGRAGKSQLANEIAGSEVFFAVPTAAAVTDGIDVHVDDGADGAVAADAADGGGARLLLDCEGGNNALAASRSLVNVLGARLAAALVVVGLRRDACAVSRRWGRRISPRLVPRGRAAVSLRSFLARA